MKGRIALLFFAVAFAFGTPFPAVAEDAPQYLSNQAGPQLPPDRNYVVDSELEVQLSQVRSELRSQRDLADLQISTLENEIQTTSAYVEKLLFAFMVAGGIVVFVVLVTLNKQSNVNNERMRNLIREAESALDDLHRLMDRPEAEHFHVSRKLSRIMNKMRERENPSLPQKEIGDIFAASEDPTLPVSLHLQANALRSEQRGDWSNAIHFWEKLLSIDDTSPEVLLHLAQNYKRIAQVSTPDRAGKMREISLDYFQKYTVRTNLHTHSERELRKMASFGLSQGPVAQSVVASEPDSPALPAGESMPAQPAIVAPAAPVPKQQTAGQAKSLTMQEYQDLKEKKPRPKPEVRKRVTESLLSIKPTVTLQKPFGKVPTKQAAATVAQQPAVAAGANGNDRPQPAPAVAKESVPVETKASAEPRIVRPASEDKEAKVAPAASAKGNGDVATKKAKKKPKAAKKAKPKKEAAAAEEDTDLDKAEKPEESTKAEEGKEGATTAETVAKPADEKEKEESPVVVEAGAAVSQAANGNGANGAGDSEPKQEEQPVAEESKEHKAFRSRMDKAKNYFTRYSSASSKKDRLMWLGSACEEFEAAAKYSTDLEMYRLWGSAILEAASVDKGNEREHVKRAIEVFEKADGDHGGVFCNELSLCHAVVDDEVSCRKALELASENGTLDPTIFLTLPDFEKYKDRSWFQELAKAYSN